VPRDGERAACEVTEIGRPGEEIGSIGSGRPGEIEACVGSVAADPRARGEADPREWRKKRDEVLGLLSFLKLLSFFLRVEMKKIIDLKLQPKN
jgi:hypothetical protein